MKDVRYIYVYMYTHIYTYNGILLSHENNEMMPSAAATWVDLEAITLSDIARQRQIAYRLDVESKKMIQTNLFTEQKETDTLKAHLQSPTGRRAGRG